MAHAVPIQTPEKNGAAFRMPCGDILDRLTRSNVVQANREAVEKYLADHPDLGSLLEGVCASARQAFGQNAELSLEMYTDPEQQDRYLTLYVRQEKYESGIIDRIEAIAHPFMAQLEAATGHLLLTTDFRRPRG